jgi:hypothetical protein
MRTDEQKKADAEKAKAGAATTGGGGDGETDSREHGRRLRRDDVAGATDATAARP